MDNLKVDKPLSPARRRMPRRAASSDQSLPIVQPSKSKRTMMRSNTAEIRANGGGSPSLRRVGTDNSREGRKVPGRSKSEAKARDLPSRSKSGSIGPNRSAPKRTTSGKFGRLAPGRTKSADGSSSKSLLGMTRKGRKKDKAGSSEDTRNIFGSDLVSTQKILDDIEECKTSTSVCRLELEDFFMAERDDESQSIALAIKELLECDDRPWEYVRFLDDIMDASIYEGFRERRYKFIKTMAGVCESRLIPVTYKAKITLSSGSLNMEEMLEVMFWLRSDRAVVELTLKSAQVDEGIIRALVELFKADKRKWKSVTLQLSGTGPGKPGSAEHKTWAKEMQAATEEMQKVCKDRGINLG